MLKALLESRTAVGNLFVDYVGGQVWNKRTTGLAVAMLLRMARVLENKPEAHMTYIQAGKPPPRPARPTRCLACGWVQRQGYKGQEGEHANDCLVVLARQTVGFLVDDKAPEQLDWSMLSILYRFGHGDVEDTPFSLADSYLWDGSRHHALVVGDNRRTWCLECNEQVYDSEGVRTPYGVMCAGCTETPGYWRDAVDARWYWRCVCGKVSKGGATEHATVQRALNRHKAYCGSPK